MTLIEIWQKGTRPFDEYNNNDVLVKLARGFRLSFDHFGRSSSKQNHQLTQYFAGKLAEKGLI